MNCNSVHLCVGDLVSPAGFGWKVEGREASKAAPSPVVTGSWAGGDAGKHRLQFFPLFLVWACLIPFPKQMSAFSCVVVLLQAFVAFVYFS